MGKVIFKPFWSYDIVKTERWLASMHAKGYALERNNFAARLFYFKEAERADYYYRIVYEKNSNGNISPSLLNGGYDKVCWSKNYYVLRTNTQNPQVAPSYIGFLDKNRKLKFAVGIVLLVLICMAVFPLLFIAFLIVIIIASAVSGNLNVTSDELGVEPSVEVASDSIQPIQVMGIVMELAIVVVLIWLIYTYFKLRSSNKQLSWLCGDKLNLSFTIPRENLLSKAAERALKREKKLVKKRRLAWFYAPDKAEIWLEKMESKGYNLYRMSKIGNSFYFIKGEPRAVKYCVDYQKKANPQYFNLNTENGWKLIFTSISRIQSINVWSQAYTDTLPLFYSDKESKLKHAKRFALTYSICFFPICILYVFIIYMNVVSLDFNLFSFINLIYLLILFEFGFFATRTILYYLRIKNSLDKE